MYCRNCGRRVDGNFEYCDECEKKLKGEEAEVKEEKIETEEVKKEENNNPIKEEEPKANNISKKAKSKTAAGLFGIFLGCLGVHNFYLGYTGKAVAQLLLTLLGWALCGIGPLAAAVWSFIEGVLILAGDINKDSSGNDLDE